MDKLNNIYQETSDFLLEIVKTNSVTGSEQIIVNMLSDTFRSLADSVEKLPINSNISLDPDYSSVCGISNYDNTCNLRITIKGKTDETIVFNTHMDTVPIAENMKTGIECGKLFGRGACDAKGQIAALYYMLKKIKYENIIPVKTIMIHLVIGEESGGNGTLALGILPKDCEAAIVLEPTSIRITIASRGVLWFRIILHGKSGHSGDIKNTKSALYMAIDAIHLLQKYHAEMVCKLGSQPPFNTLEYPLPLCIGKIHSGEWPATVPGVAVLEGIIGVLPGTDSLTMRKEIDQILSESALAGFVEAEYTLQRDSSIISEDHILVKRLQSACRHVGISQELTVFPACCDAFFYSRAGIPTVTLGAGNLSEAHSGEEYIELEQVYKLGEMLFNFMIS